MAGNERKNRTSPREKPRLDEAKRIPQRTGTERGSSASGHRLSRSGLPDNAHSVPASALQWHLHRADRNVCPTGRPPSGVAPCPFDQFQEQQEADRQRRHDLQHDGQGQHDAAGQPGAIGAAVEDHAEPEQQQVHFDDAHLPALQAVQRGQRRGRDGGHAQPGKPPRPGGAHSPGLRRTRSPRSGGTRGSSPSRPTGSRRTKPSPGLASATDATGPTAGRTAADTDTSSPSGWQPRTARRPSKKAAPASV